GHIITLILVNDSKITYTRAGESIFSCSQWGSRIGFDGAGSHCGIGCLEEGRCITVSELPEERAIGATIDTVALHQAPIHILEREGVPIEPEPDTHGRPCRNSRYGWSCCWLLTLIDDKRVIDRNVSSRINHRPLNKC